MTREKDVRFPIEGPLRETLEAKQEAKYQKEGVRPILTKLLQHYAKRGIETEDSEANAAFLQPTSNGVGGSSEETTQQLKKKLSKTNKKRALDLARIQELEAQLAAEKDRQKGGMFIPYSVLITAGVGISFLGYQWYQAKVDTDLLSSLMPVAEGKG